GGFFESTDNGLSWTLHQTGLNTKGGTDVALDPARSRMYLGTTSGAFSTTEPPGTWAAVGAGMVGAFTWSAATDPATPATLLAGTDGGVWRSSDAGATWSASGLAGRAVYAIVFDPTNTSIAYAGTDAGVF